MFLALALHADRDGVAFPSVDTLCRETGYLRKTVSAALTDLCELRIGGYPVLSRIAQRDGAARFAVSRFQIFPANVEAVGKIRPTASGDEVPAVSKKRLTAARVIVENKEVPALSVGQIRPTEDTPDVTPVGKKGDTAEVLTFPTVGKIGDAAETTVVENKEVTGSPCTSEPCTAKGDTVGDGIDDRVPSNRVPQKGTRHVKGFKNNHVGVHGPSFGGLPGMAAEDVPVAEPDFFGTTDLQESIPTAPANKRRKPASEVVIPPAFREPLEAHYLAHVKYESWEMSGPEMAKLRTAIKALWIFGGERIAMVDEFIGCFNALATMRWPSGSLRFQVVDWGVVKKVFREWRSGRIKDECNKSGAAAPRKEVKAGDLNRTNQPRFTGADTL